MLDAGYWMLDASRSTLRVECNPPTLCVKYARVIQEQVVKKRT